MRPETNTLLEPNPREISRRLLARGDEGIQEVPFLNLMAASWIQFMTHDWFSHGPNQSANPIQVPLASDDPLRAHGLTTLPIGRTMGDPSRRLLSDRSLPTTFVNEVTHWWDGSQIYGSDATTAKRLRTMSGGRLRTQDNGSLPLGSNGVEDTGFNRNWWVGLSMLHQLWLQEHNTIADMLKARYPSWNDQRLYDTARLINSALIAKIHTIEWTPAILPNETLAQAMDSNWHGLFAGLENVGITFDSSLLFGIVGNSRDLSGVPFSMPEEFVSVYRMHPLMPESISIQPIGANAPTEEIPLPATREAQAHLITERIPMADLFHSFGVSHPGALVLNNYPAFLQDLELPDGQFVDMGTIDLIRERERGVPRYNEFRRQMQLLPLNSFSQLTDDAEIVAELEDLYDGDIEKLDLMIGMFAEAHRPTNFGFGETAFQVFILIASRRLHADRFYTDSYNAETYTQAGLDWIENNSMKSVLLRHFPSLGAT
ncbi:MAG: peroxidase, partial [Polyangiaceae bacterium]|nr:peroxidase [Polyangiaceae bacterium]